MATIELNPLRQLPVENYEDGIGADPIVLRLAPAIEMTEEQFFLLATQNEDLRIEQNSQGELEIMVPVGSGGSSRNSSLNGQLYIWNTHHRLGKLFDSSGGFRFINKAMRAPDATWISLARWNQLTPEEQEVFSPIAPDFVVELRSRSDRINRLLAKMEEYMDNGVQLGWLIDPLQKRVHIYRAGQPVQVLDNPATVSGEPVLPGFVLQLGEIWN
jgi:Uma2 family endonuclease